VLYCNAYFMRRTPARQQPADRRETLRKALLSARRFVDDMRTRYRELERLTDASIAMHRALACIAATPGISASRLATMLGMKRPAVSHILKALAERGWIERVRTAADQRSVQLYLSPDGKQTVEDTAGRAVGTLQRAIGQLTDIEVDALSAGLAALLRELPQLPQPGASRVNRKR
jgi:DNA-binding MarR family transcriptional regulator